MRTKKPRRCHVSARNRLERSVATAKNEIWFLSLEDAWQKVENWRQEYNNERPHSALGQMAPARFAEARTTGVEATV
jgi:transposase InsO family protein